MIDFSTLQGLTIPEGVVTQITDESGRVIWAVSGGKVILEVEKITSDTYAGETAYTGEQFILLDIYPKTNGTVKVTYGGLTKTITDTSGAAEPNAQQVFFGTFNGVTDSVETAASGELTIEGDYYAFGCAFFVSTSKGAKQLSRCVISIIDFGNTNIIPDNAFGAFLQGACEKIETVHISDNITKIGDQAFIMCIALNDVKIGKNVTEIGDRAFFLGITDGAQPALTSVKMLSSIPPKLIPMISTEDGSINYYNFGNKSINTFVLKEIIVPKGCGNAYKTEEGWTYYADLIVEAT
jgi:hypothetical protein